MFKKAVSHDEETIFYFDSYDGKYVAKGGSLAWRTNNPGLVHTRSCSKSKYPIIGSAGKIAIFSTPAQGERALRDWLRSKKYYSSTLIALAKHYSEGAPEVFLKKLCKITFLKDDVKLCALSDEEFQSLLLGLKQLTGFTSAKNEVFFPLPKISARFYSKNSEVESYLIGFDHFIGKDEAIHWVETHRLDAIIVQRSDGFSYLRSRPGHHLEKIRLSQKEYGNDRNFEETVRGETGKKKEGQCIWGFINGIWNNKDKALKSASLISSQVGGEQVWALANDSKYWGFGDVSESIIFKINIETKVVKWAANFLKFLLHLSKEDSKKTPVILVAHSQGL